MQKNTTDHSRSEEGFQELLGRMSCARAVVAAPVDAPLALAILFRVEAENQSPHAAALARGIGLGDGAYRLGRLRRDVAVELVVMRAEGQKAQREDCSAWLKS